MLVRRCLLAGASLVWPLLSSAPSTAASAQSRSRPSPEVRLSSDRDSDRHGWYVPDFFKVQSGGYAGTLAIGAGYAAFDDILNLTLLYGYVPPVSGRSVQSLHLTASLRPLELEYGSLRLIPVYAGLGGLHTWADGYFIELPEEYPPGYYARTGIYLTMHVGTELGWLPSKGTLERHGIYFELTTLNVLLWRYFENPGIVDPDDVISIGFGYRGAF